MHTLFAWFWVVTLSKGTAQTARVVLAVLPGQRVINEWSTRKRAQPDYELPYELLELAWDFLFHARDLKSF